MVSTAVLGFPRIGPQRELKFALEAFWAGESSPAELERVAAELRSLHLRTAAAAGIDVLPSNDFSLYDHVLDTAVMVGAVPSRFASLDGLERYFAMARGTAESRPLEMTKWLDTNYHYLVPEVDADTPFSPHPEKALGEFAEALAWGCRTRPVLLGPVSFLLLAKSSGAGIRPLHLLDRLLPAYAEVLARLAAGGVTAVQIDEPCLVGDRTDEEITAVERAWRELAGAAPALELTLATYFGGLGPHLQRVLRLPAREFHLDLVRAGDQLAPALDALDPEARLSLGVIDGRNIWAGDLDAVLDLVEPVVDRLGGDRVGLAPSCSLLHVPYTVAGEESLDPELRSWLAFADEKLLELQTLKAAVGAGSARRDDLLGPSRRGLASRRGSDRVHSSAVPDRLEATRDADYERRSPYATRAPLQAERLGLPQLPTTTIGSFPQTQEIRRARRDLGRGALATDEYERFLEREISMVIERQERLGLDVLVHGEPERNDMVQYFAEQLQGFAATRDGWVQSYGSRCVKPSILFGDVARPEPTTVRWWRFAQGCTQRPVKGMLTGPVTMLQWSFVRDDQPRADTCAQLALAVRDEALDLQRAGAAVIQIDEAALREGLPLRRDEHSDYLRWAVDCFRLAAGGLDDRTQVHSHMCYSDFNAILDEIARMDADVISIEASRSDMALLDAFGEVDYPNQIGPGVYDIHSPRVPSVEEIEDLLEQAERRIPRSQLWVNPDCGLKTRGWEEAGPALENLVTAAGRRRAGRPG
ncbi:MAG: 5-methyltetrahydropteroyltriglutamate--homocysteine S-methyltransferase [Thermoleophilaceae bacterium]